MYIHLLGQIGEDLQIMAFVAMTTMRAAGTSVRN